MKILMMSSERGWRGGEVHIFKLAHHLQQAGIEVTIACKKNSESEKHCVSDGIPFINVKQSNVFDICSARQISAFCKKNKIDIIHTHSSKSLEVAVLSAKVFRNASKIIFTKHTVFPISRGWLTQKRYNNRYLKAVIGVSEVVCNQLATAVRSTNKIVKILNSVTVNLEKPLDKKEFAPDNELVIGTCSALTYEKNIPLFLDILYDLKVSNIPFKAVIVGDGRDKAELVDYAKKLGIYSDIYFTGFQSKPLDIISAFDIYLQTSTLEGFGLSLLEAFTLGKVCISSNVGAASEIITNGVNGFVINSFDRQEYLSVIKAVHENRVMISEIGEAAKIAALQLSPNLMAENTIALYRKVVDDVRK